MIYPISRLILLPLIHFFIKKSTGLENIPRQGPYIIACKHMGPLDGIFIASVIIPVIDQKIFFISNVADWGWLWKNIVAKRWSGAISYDPNNKDNCLTIAMDYLASGKIVGIFPEGIVQEYNDYKHRAKTGVARLALWARIPILPVGLAHDITVKSDLPKLKQKRQVIKNILLNPHSLEIHIGQPFEIKQFYNKEITNKLLHEATNIIMDKIDGLTNLKFSKQ